MRQWAPLDERRRISCPLPLRERAPAALQQQSMGEGASSQDFFFEETPSPIRICGNAVHALPRKGRGHLRHRRARGTAMSYVLMLAPMGYAPWRSARLAELPLSLGQKARHQKF